MIRDLIKPDLPPVPLRLKDSVEVLHNNLEELLLENENAYEKVWEEIDSLGWLRWIQKDWDATTIAETMIDVAHYAIQHELLEIYEIHVTDRIYYICLNPDEAIGVIDMIRVMV